MAFRSIRLGPAVIVSGCLGGSPIGCGGDDGGVPNMLPTAAPGTSSSPGDASGAAPTADSTAGAPIMFPATYRFDCIDVLVLGDSDGDGVADGDSIQASLLENTWRADIEAFKLNVLLTVRARDDASGSAQLVVASGVGPGAGDLCAEPTTIGMERAASFDAGVAAWRPSDAPGTCAEPATASAGGTYTFELPVTDTVYVYAEDDDGTVFNCVPGGGAPHAVPLHAVRAVVTVDGDERVSAGQLSGCLVDSEAQNLCSCLGECSGIAHPDCGGCPDGSVPLAELLGAVGPTDACTEVMGETAYDLTVGFSSVRLAGAEPPTCGG